AGYPVGAGGRGAGARAGGPLVQHLHQGSAQRSPHGPAQHGGDAAHERPAATGRRTSDHPTSQRNTDPGADRFPAPGCGGPLMLTRFVRIQLIIFTIASVIGMTVMVVEYLQAPTLLGIGRMTVKLELSGTGGLYQFSNVTYRGVEVGKVTDVRPTRAGAVATLSLKTSPKIPADLRASVLSVSAVGEQYVDLQPVTAAGPYLQDGSVIPAANTSIPQAVGPMLDQVSLLIDSVPKSKISGLLDETFRAFNGS